MLNDSAIRGWTSNTDVWDTVHTATHDKTQRYHHNHCPKLWPASSTQLMPLAYLGIQPCYRLYFKGKVLMCWKDSQFHAGDLRKVLSIPWLSSSVCWEMQRLKGGRRAYCRVWGWGKKAALRYSRRMNTLVWGWICPAGGICSVLEVKRNGRVKCRETIVSNACACRSECMIQASAPCW